MKGKPAHNIQKTYLFLRSIFLNIFLRFLSPQVDLPGPNEVKKILVIRIDQNHDIILSTPFLKQLRQNYQDAHIAVLVHKSQMGLLRGLDFINEMIEYSDDIILCYRNFDCVFDLTSDYTLKTALLAYKTKAKYRAGFDMAGRGVFFNIRVKAVFKGNHFIDQMLDLLGGKAEKNKKKLPTLPVLNESKNFINEFLAVHQISDDDLFICMHPGAFFKSQRWTPERFSNLADHLIEEYQAKVVLIGSSNDTDLINQIHLGMENGREVILFLGHPVEYVTALISRTRLLVCNNAGPLHMATAFNTPTVSTMGPTDKDRWWPRGDKHIVIRKEIECDGCKNGLSKTNTHECMDKISVDDMIQAVQMQMTRI